MGKAIDIANKSLSINVKTLITVVIFIISATIAIYKFVNNMSNRIDAVNNRITEDSIRRDIHLKDFKHFYGRDTLNNIH